MKAALATANVVLTALGACGGLGLISDAHASPWGRDQGSLFLSNGFEYFRASLDEAQTLNGLQDGTFERFLATAYAELGLTDKIMLGANARYGSSRFQRGASQNVGEGFQDYGGFVQFRFHDDERGAAAIRLGANAPSRLSDGARPGLASEGVDVEAFAAYGRTLRSEYPRLFASAEAGFRKRLSDSADQVLTNILAGIEPSSRWLVLIESFNVTSLRNEASAGADFDIYKVQPSVVWRLDKKFTVQIGVNHEFAGRNVATGRSYFISIWSTF